MKEIIALLNQASDVLRPFTHSVQAGSLFYNGTHYAPATPRSPDPYALAWWSSFQTAIALLEGLETLSASQLAYLRASFCGGMGSFNDFSLEPSRWGTDAEAANKQLSAIASALFQTLAAITPSAA